MNLSELKKIATEATKVDEFSPSRVVFDNTLTPQTALKLIELLEEAEALIKRVLSFTSEEDVSHYTQAVAFKEEARAFLEKIKELSDE